MWRSRLNSSRFDSAGTRRARFCDAASPLMAMMALALPAHSVTRMAPGGTHLMFEGLSRAFVSGDQVPLVGLD